MQATALVVHQQDIIASSASAPGREELIARYRHLREINRRHNTAMVKLLGRDALISQAKRLGLTREKVLVLDSFDDMNFVYDLLIHTSQLQRTRAIDRYARMIEFAPGSDETRMLEAMQSAQFCVFACAGRHPVAGLIIEDLFRGLEYQLIDENLERSLVDGAVMATRLFHIDGFAMTGGVLVPMCRELLQATIADNPQLARKSPQAMLDSRRFAEAIYRQALAGGRMEFVDYAEPDPVPH